MRYISQSIFLIIQKLVSCIKWLNSFWIQFKFSFGYFSRMHNLENLCFYDSHVHCVCVCRLIMIRIYINQSEFFWLHAKLIVTIMQVWLQIMLEYAGHNHIGQKLLLCLASNMWKLKSFKTCNIMYLKLLNGLLCVCFGEIEKAFDLVISNKSLSY